MSWSSRRQEPYLPDMTCKETTLFLKQHIASKLQVICSEATPLDGLSSPLIGRTC